MYLYLGQDTVIGADEIIGIFDIDNTSTSRTTRDFLTASQKNGRVVEVSPELPKSFVVCEKNRQSKVYLSQISPATLKKRSTFLKGLSL